jgi:carboxypeptidase Taq
MQTIMTAQDTLPDTQAAAGYRELLAELREAALLHSSVALLAWDQETMMPRAGAGLRAEQMAQLESLAHRQATQPRIGELLSRAEADSELNADPLVAANLREGRRQYDRAVQLPEALVREFTEVKSLAMEAWRDAREQSDFRAFQPWLTRIVELSRRKAECHGAGSPGEMYDHLLQDYEPGMDSANIDQVFGELRSWLVPFVAEIAAAPHRPSDSPHRIRVPIERQKEFNRLVAERIGFDFSSGRMDVSTHPFCTFLGPGDTRLTTRYTEDRFADALSSTMHETGHALYDQGLPKGERFGQPVANVASHALHESQSRLWENQVGRSLSFWRWATPEARRILGEAVEGVTPEAITGAVNRVEPSLIRVDSDEVTYHLHIMLRYDLERALLTGELAPADLPGAWNERMKQDLGLVVPDDARGCLQDVHWSHGYIGYFPTYTLGTLFSAQFWSAARRDLAGLEEGFARCEFAPLLEWLRDRIHRHGSRFTPPELCERVTGAPLGPRPLVDYFEERLRPLYGI